MGRIIKFRVLSIFRIIVSAFLVAICFSSCKKNKDEDITISNRNKVLYLKENIRLEKENHINFINEIAKDKRNYFEDKADQFISEYDNFGLFNILKRRWFRTKEENMMEISQSLHLAFNLIDYQELEQKKINEYLDRIKINRRQFELGEKEYYVDQDVINWKDGTVLRDIKKGANQMVTDIENDITGDIINLGIAFFDILDIILLVVSMYASEQPHIF